MEGKEPQDVDANDPRQNLVKSMKQIENKNYVVDLTSKK
jgi:hypothetical protein